MAILSPSKTAEGKIRRDIRVLADLTEVYCRKKHAGVKRTPIVAKGKLENYADALNVSLCPECMKLVLHGTIMRIKCPMGPKPVCKYCPDHCYHPKYRNQIREVMRFAWRHLLLRGRIDLVLRHL
jgi:hypothetical protein